MRPIKNLVNQFLIHSEHIEGLSLKYLSSINSTWKFFQRYSSFVYLEQCTYENIEEWLINNSLERNWKPATFRSCHRNLNAIFKWAVERKYMETNPMDNIRKPKLHKSLPKSISLSEAEKILGAIKYLKYAFRFEEKRNVAIIATMIFTGIRKSELTSLRVEDISLESMFLRVNEGKGGKDRVIPISSRLYIILNEYINERIRLNKKCEYFFTGAQFDRKMTSEGVDNLIKRLREKTKIYFSAYSLRHSFATLMLEGGCDIYTLSRMLGHEKITTTTIYLSCSPRMMFSSIEKHPLN